MVALISFLLNMLASLFKSKSRLEAENAALRHQLIVLQRKVRGRPQIDADLRALIRRMSLENALWGAPHIHGELLKLGFAVAQSTVAKYMAKPGDPSGQRWGTFLRNQCRTSQRWICSWFRLSALSSSTFWSLSGWLGESLSGPL